MAQKIKSSTLKRPPFTFLASSVHLLQWTQAAIISRREHVACHVGTLHGGELWSLYSGAISNSRGFTPRATGSSKDFGTGFLGGASEIALPAARDLPIQFCPPALGLFPQAFGGGAG